MCLYLSYLPLGLLEAAEPEVATGDGDVAGAAIEVEAGVSGGDHERYSSFLLRLRAPHLILGDLDVAWL